MDLNVNYTSLYKHGIDTSVLKEVSNEILRRAAQKNPEFTNTATTKQVQTLAKPQDLGIDLYQGKVNSTVQRQIAMNNALQFQFNQATINSINYLNTQAAVTRNIDGKYMPSVNEVVTETQKAVETNAASHFVKIVTSETAKDKEGSNPFYHGELLLGKQASENAETKNVDSMKSIFA